MRALIVTGLVAALVATALTTLAAALARAAGVDLEVPDDGETIPLSGIAVMTAFFSIVGVAIGVALRRWSARPAERFVGTTGSLVLVSLVPPVLVGADAATTVTLIGLHLVAASVMIPALAWKIRDRQAQDGRLDRRAPLPDG
jgi:UDP-N-acetylmuramyl pentapeptide phosphotransferase/UDP-N-acetylglucosamine-1-phosphate transferase